MLNKLAYLQFAQGWGVYEGARDLLLETVRLAKQIGSVIAEAMAQRNLAIVYTCMGNYAAALPHLQRTQEIYRQNVPDADDPTLLNYWGFYLFSQGRLEDALAMQLAALAGLTSHSVRQWRVKALTALGWIHMRLGKHDEAVRYAEESMAQSGAINEQRQLAYALIVRGILHTNRGELVAARARFADACAILHAYEMENRAQEAEVGLAYVDFLEGENACALERTHAILAHLEAHPIDFTEDSCQLLYTCLCILRVLDGAALPRLCKLIQLHLSTRTATLDAETTRLFWQHPIHQELRELIVCAG
jgi:tetratricopeptide (TPR) repeat protein